MSGMDLFGKEERKEVMDVIETSCLFRYNHEHLRAGMWKSKELEQEVQSFTGAKFAHATSSGSTAVSTMLAAAGIGYGDEVIVPPFTFLAPIEAVLLAGALPVFADIDETLCLSAAGIKKVLTPKTKAVLVVHMCGASANMDEIVSLCSAHQLTLVEDCGQALGAFYKGKSVGLFGKAGSFSFDFFKIATMGEGGMLITNEESTYQTMSQLSDHGHSHLGNNRGMESHPILGINYRSSELSAAVGLAQMRKIALIKANNLRAKAYLKNALSQIEGITFRKMDDPTGDSGTFLNFFTPSVASTQKVVKQLSEDAVPQINYWFTNMYHFINQWEHLKDLRFPAKLVIHALGAPQDYHHLDLPQAQDVIGRLISISIKSNWTEEELHAYGEKLVKAIRKVI